MHFGDYELLEEIARGGMGIVYKARQKSLNRTVAVKVLLASQFAKPESVQRFHTEAEAIGQLHHPNIVAVHEIGEWEGQPYFSMDYIEGRTLAEFVRERPLPPKRAATYMAAVAAAVHYAHGRGILHRDLKPSNVLIDADDQPRVTDFGLAKRLADSQLSTPDPQLTLTGQVLGSPNYLPPEQAAGKRTVGPASDVYALGAILYHLVTGRPPFHADSITTLLQQVIETEPVAPRLLNASIPRDLETICLKCLEKEPPRRYATAQALADDLGRFLRKEPIVARPVGPAGKAWRWCRRQPVRASLIAALVVVFGLGLAGVLWQWQRAKANELFARQNAYAADMNLAERAVEEGDIGRAMELLNRHRPLAKSGLRNPQSEADLRGWEWRYLWGRCRSDERFILHQYSNLVSALAYSSDGQHLAVRREGGAVALWNPVTHNLRTNFAGAGGSRALAFSPRGELLAWGSQADTGTAVLSLRDMRLNKVLPALPHPALVVAVAIHPDAKVLATLAWDGVVRIWQIESQRVLTNFSTTEMVTEDLGCLAFSPDGKTLAVGDGQGAIRLVDWRTGHEPPIPVFPAAQTKIGEGITALALSPDGKRLAAGCCYSDARVHLWDLEAGNETMLTGHTAWIAALAFSPDGKTLASASADHSVRLWDVRRKTEVRRLQGHWHEVSAVAWSPDGKDLVTGSPDGSVRYWDPVATAEPSPNRVLPPTELYAVAFSSDSKKMFAVRRNDGAVVLWDTASLQPVETLIFLGSNQLSVAFWPDSRLLAVADRVGKVRVWDIATRRLRAELPSASGMFCELAFSRRGHLLRARVWSQSGGCKLKIWDTATFAEISLEGVNLKGLWKDTLAPNERILAVGHTDGTVTWWDMATRPPHATLQDRESETVPCMAFSPDGRWFATGTGNGLMTVWDVARQRPKRIARAHLNMIQGLAFSPKERRLITGAAGSRDAVKLWDPETGRDLATLAAEYGEYHAVGFSPDGNILYATCFSGTFLLWRAPSWEQIAAQEARER